MTAPHLTYTDESGHAITLTWLRDDDIKQYQPCTQAYGIVFNDQCEILLIEHKGRWQIPGGTPEPGETPEVALRRELVEEADVTIAKVRPLGVQKVEYPASSKSTEGKTFYQYRYVCTLDQLLESTPDPDNGLIYPRMFVPAAEVTKHVDWGEVGDAMFTDAIKLYQDYMAKGE